MMRDSIDLMDLDPQMKQIKAGSHSRLAVFEACKYRAKLAFVDRIPEPERPLPPGKTEHANDRGTRIHDAAERFVKGGVELIPELKSFEPEFLQLKALHGQGKVSTEGEWAFNRSWEPVAWMSHDTFMRIKCDAVVSVDRKRAVVIDYKSGKRWGNEVKHAEQMQVYQLGAFIRYPELEEIDVELWYTDQNEVHGMKYRRDQGMRFLPGIEQRLVKMTTETEFPPNPNAHTCRFCPYKSKEKGGSGHCSVGV